MTSCILTVIKNEHDYLDEWIRYHLDFGIDHIFIFEDIDSDSHKYITDNYDNVTLEGIDSVLNEHYRNEARILKKTKRYNAQHFYYKSAMNYLKDNFKYDWVFIIDADEFITLEDNTAKLSDILKLYDDYDSFIMRWKCYGANGHIHKPDYRDKGVIDTYTKEMTGAVRDDNKGFVKTCHNLNSYRPEYFYNQHHPSEKANWCNTSYEYHSYSPSYKNIYIRHYITKSWEEYLWKLNNRGYFWGRARNVDQFFSINDDMISLKQFLINNG